MDHHTEGNNKKRLIAFLLLVSSIISILILVYTSGSTERRLSSFAQADSLILNTLQQFNIESRQYYVRTIQVDSGFTRKRYSVDVPPGFSKTLLHAELNRTFHPLDVQTPAKVFLPDESVRIQLIFEGTVFRTLTLETDEDLILERDIASIVVAFDDQPTQDMIDAVIRFGEPIPIALRVSGASQVREGIRNINSNYAHISYWIETQRNDDGMQTTFPPASLLEHVPANTPVLSFQGFNTLPSSRATSVTETATENNLTFIDVNDAIILDSNRGESFFKQELEKFAVKARQQDHPVAIVMADEEALEWLREKLAALKKSGLYLIHPPKISF